jgi:dolichol-phosphate mannosyltransferase
MQIKGEEIISGNIPQVSILIPTYNESENIIEFLKSVQKNLPEEIFSEIIVIDDNSPDGTGKIVEEYIRNNGKISENKIFVINRKGKKGLSSAILDGIHQSKGNNILVMDSDFSHPPEIITKMIQTLKNSQCDIVIASRYIKGGGVTGWPFKRKVMSKVATKIAKKGLGIKNSDPMSGFFAFKRAVINGIKFDAIGYKMLLEILVKAKGVTVKEIPYTFSNRQVGSSKLSSSIIIDYIKSVWKLYRYGKAVGEQEKRTSVRFLSKAARFYTVGASGVVVNYFASLYFGSWIPEIWYLHANVIGIIFSMTSNFVLNKIWTFEEKDYRLKTFLFQYGKFVVFSSFGAVVQLGLVYFLVDEYSVMYPVALIVAILIAASANYLLNKKFTFKEKLWS